MSERMIAHEQTRLWWVRRLDQRDGHLFSGDLRAAVRHINALHLGTGLQYAARDLGQD